VIVAVVRGVVAVLFRASIAAAAPRAARANAGARAGAVSAAVEEVPEVEVEVVAAEEAAGGADRLLSSVRFRFLVTETRPGNELTEDSMSRLFNQGKKQAINTGLLIAAIAWMFLLQDVGAAAVATHKSFSSADEAAKAAVNAARNNDDKTLLAIFGAQAKQILFSGDPVADKERRAHFIAAYDEKNRLAEEGRSMILIVGKQDWPFPIPLVKKGQGWVFDTEKGKQEILNRRVGENELNTIQSILAVVDAEREYAIKDHNSDGLLEYAQKFVSDPGKKNGLYWDVKQGEPQSPLGPIMIRARQEGYQRKSVTTPSPYHGYYYRIISAQGKNAPGGAYSYIVKGKMIGGFAVVAYPAEYGNSGVMTFIVNHDGKVFQKNLGANTAAVAKGMKEYNPDKTWTEVKS
jgi:hypothetical protein